MPKNIILNTNKINPKADLTNKKILVTGASSGIGKAVALRLRKFNARVLGVSNQYLMLFKLPAIIEILKVDITHEEQVKKIFYEYGEFDYLVHCAGYIKPDSIILSSSKEWVKQIKTNLIGSYFILKYFFQNNLKNGKAITISSSSGFKGRKNWSSYCASKAGLISLTESLSEELYENCEIYDIAPSRVATKMRKMLFPNEDQTNMQKPEDIAKLVHHIIGGKLKKYSGKSLHIENRDVKLWREYEA